MMLKPTPAISIIVPSHNGALRLPELLTALAAQDFAGEWEVLVCLDGSTDRSRALLTEWESHLPLRVLETSARQGVSGALNLGYAAAKGEVLVRCDDDLTPRPDFVSRHQAWHSRGQPIGVIGPTRDAFPDNPYAQMYGRPTNKRALQEMLRTPPARRWVHWAANNSIHRDAWVKSGGFDTELLYGQDSEFGFRLAKLGIEIVIDPELTAEHRGPATTTQRRARRAFISGASRVARERKHPDTKQPTEKAPRPRRATSSWDRLVAKVSKSLPTADSCDSLGRHVDRSLQYLPPKVGQKVVALVVEASAAAGYSAGPDDLAAFSDQKPLELAEEAGLARAHWPQATDGVSVVIPSYGDPSTAQELVESLCQQVNSPPLEIIVADDASPVPFPEDRRVRVIRSDTNRGFGAAVNSGAAVSSHPWLLVMNSDIRIPPDFVGRLVHEAERFQPSVCGVRQVSGSGQPMPAVRADHTPLSILLPRVAFLAPLRKYALFRRLANVADPAEEGPGRVDWLVGSLLLIPRSEFLAVGGFDERFFMYSEEADLQRRLRDRGTPAVLCTDLTIEHLGGISTAQLDVPAQQLASQLLYIEKWYGGWTRRVVAVALRGLGLDAR